MSAGTARRPAASTTLLLALAASPAPVVGRDPASLLNYPSVQAALADLRARPHAEIRDEDGWTVITDGDIGPQTTWTFAPRSHPAYPVVVRRDAVMKNGEPTLVTRVLCEGPNKACEDLYANLRNSD